MNLVYYTLMFFLHTGNTATTKEHIFFQQKRVNHPSDGIVNGTIIAVSSVIECAMACSTSLTNCSTILICEAEEPKCILSAEDVTGVNSDSCWAFSSLETTRKVPPSVNGSASSESEGTETNMTTDVVDTTSSSTVDTAVCQNGGSWDSAGGCVCIAATTGDSCETRFQDCEDYKTAGYTTPGPYDVWPLTFHKPFAVSCYLSPDSAILMLFRSESDPDCELNTVSPPYSYLDRSWEEYQQGFGRNYSGGNCYIWLGLEKIRALTQVRPYDLIVQIDPANNNQQGSRYSNFMVGEETSRFPMTYSSYKGHGSEGDGFHSDTPTTVNGSAFCTKDRCGQNDCAALQGGGWWFRDDACHEANPHQKMAEWNSGGESISFSCIKMWLTPHSN